MFFIYDANSSVLRILARFHPLFTILFTSLSSVVLTFVCEGFSDERAIARPIKGSPFGDIRVMIARKRKGDVPLEA